MKDFPCRFKQRANELDADADHVFDGFPGIREEADDTVPDICEGGGYSVPHLIPAGAKPAEDGIGDILNNIQVIGEGVADEIPDKLA